MFRFEEWESEREERKKERKEGRKEEREKERKRERKKRGSFFASLCSLARSLEGNNKKPLRSLRFAPLEGTKEKKNAHLE